VALSQKSKKIAIALNCVLADQCGTVRRRSPRSTDLVVPKAGVDPREVIDMSIFPRPPWTTTTYM